MDTGLACLRYQYYLNHHHHCRHQYCSQVLHCSEIQTEVIRTSRPKMTSIKLRTTVKILTFKNCSQNATFLSLKLAILNMKIIIRLKYLDLNKVCKFDWLERRGFIFGMLLVD